jgi:hypothetical protein
MDIKKENRSTLSLEKKVYSNLEAMLAAIRDENGVLHPQAISVNPGNPVSTVKENKRRMRSPRPC